MDLILFLADHYGMTPKDTSQKFLKSLEETLSKKLGDMRPGHEYLDRKGPPGHYKYTYAGDQLKGRKKRKIVNKEPIEEKTNKFDLDKKIVEDKQREIEAEKQLTKESMLQWNTQPQTILLSRPDDGSPRSLSDKDLKKYSRNVTKQLLDHKEKEENIIPELLPKQGSYYSMGAAPLQTTTFGDLKSLTDYFKQPIMEKFKKQSEDEAVALGIDVLSNDNSIGTWSDTDLKHIAAEASLKTNFQTNDPQMAKAFASIMGQSGQQQSVYLANYNQDANGYEYRLKLNDLINAENVARIQEQFGFTGNTLDLKNNTLYFGDADKSNQENFVKLRNHLEKHGVKYEAQTRKANIEFIDSKQYAKNILDAGLNPEDYGSRIGKAFEGNIGRGRWKRYLDDEYNARLAKNEIKTIIYAVLSKSSDKLKNSFLVN